ncbi:hypothetical protein AJ88_08295 [Mesorhizobium amorphae CCBAU 01583]|nr:hypothetical protein AJ88_08295 [Mesorhizobium amorphae CCBAU 01583]
MRETLLAAGEDLGLAEVGFYALNALRLEKSFGIWSREFTQAYTPAQTGLDRFIAFGKGDFIGRDAALTERDGGGARQCLATLEVDAVDADASGFEPVWYQGRRVGFVTSGGYGYTVGRSLALALVERDFATEGTALSVHIVGVERQRASFRPRPTTPRARRCGNEEELPWLMTLHATPGASAGAAALARPAASRAAARTTAR